MTDDLPDDVRRNAEVQEQRDAGVPHVMEADAVQSGGARIRPRLRRLTGRTGCRRGCALSAVSPAADEPHVLPAEAGQSAALQAETGPLEYKYINRKQATQSQKRICARKGGTLPRYSPFVHDADLAREMPFAKFKAEHCKGVSEAAGQARVSASISWLVWRSHVPTRWLRFEVIAVLGRAGESR